jgi:cytidylate kinase
VIAIDGPAGSGKSTVAAAVAARTTLPVLHTGAMYRAATLAAQRAGADLADGPAVAAVAAAMRLDVGDRVLLDGEDVTDELRSPAVDGAVSVVAAQPQVREILVDAQRAWVRERGGAVVEGRDIGTVVFPDAQLKVYLTASPEVRAARRAEEAQAGSDGPARIEAVAERLERRDRMDSGRAASPLAVAADAHVVDSSGLDVEAVVEKVLALL